MESWSFLKTGITNAIDGSQGEKVVDKNEITKMEVSQGEFDHILDPESDSEESEALFVFSMKNSKAAAFSKLNLKTIFKRHLMNRGVLYFALSHAVNVCLY